MSHSTTLQGVRGDAAWRLRRRLVRTMLGTVTAHGLVEDGDRILVAVSGGKDSATLLDLLAGSRRRAPVRFDLLALHVDQGQPGHDDASLRAWAERIGMRLDVVREDTYSIVLRKSAEGAEATYCRVCSRLRRGILYTAAERLGCNKIALGHHRDDALETLLLNLLYSGRLQAMPAIYTTNDGRFRVMRPLLECSEAEIARHARHAGYPILPCDLCGSQADRKRVAVARLLDDLERRIPDVRQVMLAALKNVRPTHLLDAEVAAAWRARADDHPPRR